MNNTLIQIEYLRSFQQYHDQKRRFQFGEEIVLEKKKNKTSKVLPRRVHLQEAGFVQQNGKAIPYPLGFNMITKEEFQRLPEPERNAMPWTTNPQSTVRVYFCRQANPQSLIRSQSKQFEKPTAVYFTDKVIGQRFVEFLKFRNVNTQRETERVHKIAKAFKYACFNLIMIDASSKLERLRKAHNKKIEQLFHCTRRSNSIINFDQRILHSMFDEMVKNAEKKIQAAKQARIRKFLTYVPKIKKIEKLQLQGMVSVWFKRSADNFEKQKLKEEEEQLRLQQMENQAENLDEEPVIQPANNHHVESEYKDFSLSNFVLILDDRIKLTKPVINIHLLRREQRAVMSIKSKQSIFQSENSITMYWQQDQRGWSADFSLEIRQYGPRDIIEIKIFDELPMLNDRVMIRVQEQETHEQAFLAQLRRLMQQQVKYFEIQRLLHNNKRDFYRLDISSDFFHEHYENRWRNLPMLQVDVHEREPFNLEHILFQEGSIINPFYMDMVLFPLDANELKHLKALPKQNNRDLTQTWRKLKLNYIEQGLQMRGQSQVNNKWSQDLFVEAQEYLQEIGMPETQSPIINLFHHEPEEAQSHAGHKFREIVAMLMSQKSDDVVMQCILNSCQRGLTMEARLQLYPVLLRSSETISQLAREFQLDYQINRDSIWQQLAQKAHIMLENRQIQQNNSRIAKYFEYLCDQPVNVFSEMICNKLKSKLSEIQDVYHALYLKNCQVSIPLIFKVFQMVTQSHADFQEAVFIIVQSLQIEPIFPVCENIYYSIEAIFYDHVINFFSDFFYFDAWLRVMDYVIGVGFVSGNINKALASVVGGIILSVGNEFRTLDELKARLKFFGKLTCDAEQLIEQSYMCFQSCEFSHVQLNPRLNQLIETDIYPIDSILQEQKRYDPNSDYTEEFVIDVPEEHEDSIIREVGVLEEQAPTAQCQFVKKPIPKRIHMLIHKVTLHTVTYGETKIRVTYGDTVVEKIQEQEQFYAFQFIKTSAMILFDIQHGDNKFKASFNIHSIQPNACSRINLILEDDYEFQRHYMISEIDFSILVVNNDENPLSGQSWKEGIYVLIMADSSMSYPVMKAQIMKHFKQDPVKFSFQDFYSELMQNRNFYYIDFITVFILNSKKDYQFKCDQLYTALNLFSPIYGDGLYFQQVRQAINQFYVSRGLQPDDYLSYLKDMEVKFLKVTLQDENYQVLKNVTEQFNDYLRESFLHSGSYNLNLVQNNKVDILVTMLCTGNLPVLSQILNLKLKYLSYGQIKKVSYKVDSQFNLMTTDNVVAKDLIQEALNSSSVTLPMDTNRLIKRQEFQNILDQLPIIQTDFKIHKSNPNQSLAYVRSKHGVKQLQPCTITGYIKAKKPQNGDIQYFVIERGAKTQIVYREDVCMSHEIEQQELQLFEKPWKPINQQSYKNQQS